MVRLPPGLSSILSPERLWHLLVHLTMRGSSVITPRLLVLWPRLWPVPVPGPAPVPVLSTCMVLSSQGVCNRCQCRLYGKESNSKAEHAAEPGKQRGEQSRWQHYVRALVAQVLLGHARDHCMRRNPKRALSAFHAHVSWYRARGAAGQMGGGRFLSSPHWLPHMLAVMIRWVFLSMPSSISPASNGAKALRRE